MERLDAKGFFKDKGAKRRFIIVSLVVVVLVIILARTTGNIHKILFKKAVSGKKPGAAMLAGREDEAVPVKAYEAKKTDFKDTLPCIGNVKGFNEIDLKFQVAGVIESFNFKEGEKVKSGDIIASLVQRDQLLKLKYAELELKKNQKLFEAGAISQMKLEQSQLEYESAKSELDKTNIYAASDGILGMRSMDTGSYASPADKIGVFAAMDKVLAEFNIIERDVPKVSLGQKAEVYADAYPGKSFVGAIDRVSPIIEGRSRTELVKVELENKEELLKPGMFVRAVIYTYEKTDVLVIPSSALKKKENDYFIYVIHEESPEGKAPSPAPGKAGKGKALFGMQLFGKKAEKAKPAPEPAKEDAVRMGTVEVRKVSVGYMTQDLVEIESGLGQGELIIIEAQEDFKDKARVEISETQESLV